MKKLNMIFDVDRCNNCNNCLLAVKDEYVGNSFSGYSAPQPAMDATWLSVERVEHGQSPMIDVAHLVNTCQLCAKPACVNAETEGAVFQRDDGIVIIDPERAKGRRDIVDACPYGQIFWNEELKVPQKYTFDAHLLDDGWREPRASQVCPTRALSAVFADDADMAERVKAEGLQTRENCSEQAPRFYYKNLERIDCIFIGGNLFGLVDDVETCLEGVEVALFRANQQIATTKTDAFGDFRFERLQPDTAEHDVRIVNGVAAPGTFCEGVTLNQSTYLGSMKVEVKRVQGKIR